MQYLLDTNAVIALFNRSNAGFRTQLTAHLPTDIGIPSVVMHELYYGAFKSQRTLENLNKVEQLPFEVLSMDKEDARTAGEIRARLAHAGAPIGPYDVLIAGQALARGLVLVTNNVKEFSRISELKIEDWLTAQ